MTLLEEITTVLSEIKKDSVTKSNQALTPRLCSRGHDRNKYSRKDRECGACHSLKNARYRSTPKGREKYLYSKMRQDLRRRIKDKKSKIAQLERALYE